MVAKIFWPDDHFSGMTLKNDRKALEELFVHEVLLRQLEAEAKRFNLFQIAKISRKELVHSECLAYFLDPSANHGFGTCILDEVLGGFAEGAEVDRLDFHLAVTSDAEVLREWNFIDILIKLPREKIVIAIENKIDSEEHSNQLRRYSSILHQHFGGWNVLRFFLTIEGTDSPQMNWQRFAYRNLLASLKRGAAALNTQSVDSAAASFLTQYIDNLERFVMPENTIKELCLKIYSKHKQAIDLINKHLPDVREQSKSLLLELIALARLDILSSTYARIDFIPPEWRQILNNLDDAGKKAVLTFYVELRPDGVSLYLYITKSHNELLRRSLYDAAIAASLTRNEHSPQWTRLWSKELADFEKENIDGQLQSNWSDALAEIEQRIIPVFSQFVSKT